MGFKVLSFVFCVVVHARFAVRMTIPDAVGVHHGSSVR